MDRTAQQGDEAINAANNRVFQTTVVTHGFCSSLRCHEYVLGWDACAGNQARIAQQVNLQLDALRQPLTDLAHCTLEGTWEEARELVGRLGDVLRAVWAVADGVRGWAVGQRRMGHFMRVLGSAFTLYAQVRAKLSAADRSN